MYFRPSLGLVVLVSAISVLSVSAYADSQSVSNCTNCNGYTFRAGLTPVSGSTGEYTLSYKITNVSGATARPYTWSLTLFDSGDTLSPAGSLSMSNGDQSAYQLLVGKSSNGNTNCNGAIGNAICVKPSGLGPLTTLGKGQSRSHSTSTVQIAPNWRTGPSFLKGTVWRVEVTVTRSAHLEQQYRCQSHR